MEDKQKAAVEIDFKDIAEEDATHFANFKLHLTDYPLILGIAVLFFVVLLQFLTRYVLNDSVAWTEEAARYLLILLAFAGAARCQAMDTHITLEFMDRYYGRFKPFVVLFSRLATFGLILVLCWTATMLIQKTMFQQMVSLPFPKYYLYAAAAGFLTLNALVLLFQIYAIIRRILGRK